MGDTQGMKPACLLLAAAVAVTACDKTDHSNGAAAASAVKGKPQTNGAGAKRVAKRPWQGLRGRWKGATVCLELYATGDFRLSHRTHGPKVVLVGTAAQKRRGDGQVELTLHVEAIKRSRWVSKCRKHVVFPKLLDSHSMLGVELNKKKPTTLRIRQLPGGAINLCGQRCENNMKPEPLQLFGNWRRAAISDWDKAQVTWKPGEVLSLDLQSSVRVLMKLGGKSGAINEIYGTWKTTPKSDGSFALEVMTISILQRGVMRRIETPVPLLGGTTQPKGTTTLTVTRIKRGVRVCRGHVCSQLKRYVSRY